MVNVLPESSPALVIVIFSAFKKLAEPLEVCSPPRTKFPPADTEALTEILSASKVPLIMDATALLSPPFDALPQVTFYYPP